MFHFDVEFYVSFNAIFNVRPTAQMVDEFGIFLLT